MNTQNNKPRLTIENGINAYIPLPNNKGMNIQITKGMYLKHMVSVRTRDWALYDYADFGLKNQALLEALCNEEYLADTLENQGAN